MNIIYREWKVLLFHEIQMTAANNWPVPVQCGQSAMAELGLTLLRVKFMCNYPMFFISHVNKPGDLLATQLTSGLVRNWPAGHKNMNLLIWKMTHEQQLFCMQISPWHLYSWWTHGWKGRSAWFGVHLIEGAAKYMPSFLSLNIRFKFLTLLLPLAAFVLCLTLTV